MANEKRLIDANALMAYMEECSEGLDKYYCGYAKSFVDNAPTVDAVEVVRCKDCKHFTEGMAVGMCKRVPDKPIIPVVYDHFCSYGERREGE